MMCVQSLRDVLFSYKVNLDERVRSENPLRRRGPKARLADKDRTPR